jgi:hypothetical protein
MTELDERFGRSLRCLHRGSQNLDPFRNPQCAIRNPQSVVFGIEVAQGVTVCKAAAFPLWERVVNAIEHRSGLFGTSAARQEPVPKFPSERYQPFLRAAWRAICCSSKWMSSSGVAQPIR